MAQVAAISVSHLKVLFRRTFGMPPHQYVIRRRVERARTLLYQGKMPLSQIALEAGFAHQSHMAQCMKRILGVTPAALIRMQR
jgi:AraC family transcriptional regulator